MDKIIPLKAQLQNLRAGGFNWQAAKIIVANLKEMVEGKEVTWCQLETSAAELDRILFNMARKPHEPDETLKP